MITAWDSHLLRSNLATSLTGPRAHLASCTEHRAPIEVSVLHPVDLISTLYQYTGYTYSKIFIFYDIS